SRGPGKREHGIPHTPPVSSRARRRLLERSRLRVVRGRLMSPAREASRTWRQLEPQRGVDLADARLQLHHAAQLATAFGISYLPPQPDDSHTNLEWIETVGALASNAGGVPPIRLAARPHAFAILVLDERANVLGSYLLDGRTIDDAVSWIRGQLAEFGLDPARYTLERHYEIPPHGVDNGSAFSATHSHR